MDRTLTGIIISGQVGLWVIVVKGTCSDGDNIIIIIIIIGFLGLRFKSVLRWLRWYLVGCIGISLVALVFRCLSSPR